MDYRTVRKVAIVGAGVSGIATARALIPSGVECVIFERGQKVGGVWADGYSNFGVQVQRELYQFPDMPLPDDIPTFAPGEAIQAYIHRYADEYGILPFVRFGTTVTNLAEKVAPPTNTGQPGYGGWSVFYEDANGAPQEEHFDAVVVATGLYSSHPNIPQFKGHEAFGGRIMHVSELKDRAPLKDNKVVVVGLGKSATDAALESSAAASSTTILFRQAHWPIPQKIAGVIPFKWGFLTRLVSILVPPSYKPNLLTQVVHMMGAPLVWLWWRLVEHLLVLQHGLWKKAGPNGNMIPRAPIEVDAFSEATMLPQPEFYKSLRKGAILPLLDEIDHFTADGLVLKSGARLDADVVLMGTGWHNEYKYLSGSIRSRLGFGLDGFYLYRHMVHPDVPGLIFIGQAATIESTLTFGLQARWLAELIKGSHRLPRADAMSRDIAEMRVWKRELMPFSSSRSARLLAQAQQYYDQLLLDMEADPWRKQGGLAPLKEVLAPYQPSDYTEIISGAFRGRASSRAAGRSQPPPPPSGGGGRSFGTPGAAPGRRPGPRTFGSAGPQA